MYILSSQKNASVFDMGEWRDGVWHWCFSWTRNLFDRELQRVDELKRLLRSFSPKMGQGDSWAWIKEGSGSYSVKSAYEVLQGDVLEDEGSLFNNLWRAKAPSNSRALAWRVLLNKVQTKVELVRRNAIPTNSGISCGLCLLEDESVSHLFFSCSIAWKVWMKLCRWLGVSTVLPMNVKAHFVHFGFILGARKNMKCVSTLLWIAAISSLWFYRNKAIFEGGVVDVEKITELIQFKVWLWLKAKGRNFQASSSDWILNPICCITAL